MDPADWQRIAAVVDRVLDLDTDQRSSFLDELGASDPQLRREIDAFLAGEAASRGFLERPVDARATALFRAMAGDEPAWDASQLDGQMVGPYRIVRELGHGGMGAVFLAERVGSGFEQRVALKLVKRGMDSAEILERFRVERQILARLQHQHIARLLDGGASDAGQPYFAMEYVDGAPLTRYCDERSLGVGERLRLFLQVCDAVDYAHRNLVVHRDLKPSNVLVTADGQARLLDFGIAKLLERDADSGEQVALTRREDRVLTPQYAAPEQLLGRTVTTATDVYSLGVVLYELLSGRLPYRLRGLTTAEIERVVAEQTPTLLSTIARRRTDSEGEPSTEAIAAARGLHPPQLAAALRGDLEKVVAMALRKEPARRYASANALAEDLRGYLSGRPVAAQGDRWTYRTSKFVRRHRLGVAAVALVALSLAGGLLAALWQAREALRQARRAEEVKRFTFSLFELSDPDAAKGKEITARQLLERGTARVQSELASQPELESEMLLFLGNIYHRLTLNKESRALREKALTLRREGHGDELAVSEADLAVGWSIFAMGDAARAEEHFARTLEVRSRRLGDDNAQTALARAMLGRARFEKGDLVGAEPLLRQAVDVLRRRLPASEELGTNLTALGIVLQTKGDLAGAEPLYRESLDLRRQLFGEEHSHVAASMFNLAAVMKDRGDLAGAETLYRQVLAIYRRRLGPTHELLASVLSNLGTTLVTEGKFAEGEVLLRESLDVRTRLHGADSPLLANNLHSLAHALRWQGRFADAEALARRALELAVGQLGNDHASVAAVREELARIVLARGQSHEAETLARQALDICRRKLGPDHGRVASASVTLGLVLLAERRPTEAETLLREALRIRIARYGEGDWRTAEARLRLGECLAASQRDADAAPLLSASRSTLAVRLGDAHPLTVQAAAALERLGPVSSDPVAPAR